MAPALTEPISPTNKLSESTSSASPRPIIISNLLITSNNSNTSLSEIQNNINKNTNSNKNINNIEKNQNLYPIRRPPLKTFCAFQSAFEEAIAKARKTKTIKFSDSDIDEKNLKLKNNITKRKILIKTNTAKLSKESLGINKRSILSNGPPDDNLSSEQIVDIVTNLSNTLPITSTTIDRDIQQMGPMCDAQATNSSTIEQVQQQQPTISTNANETTTTLIYNDKDLQNVQQLTKINNNNNNNNNNNQFITLDSDFEEAINNTLNNKDSNKQQEQILLKFEEFQHMDLQNCDDSTIVPPIISTSNQQQCSSNIINKNQTEEIELSQGLISTCTTDTTVTASDSDNILFDDHFPESTQGQEQQGQHHQQITLESSRRSPPRTPTSTSSLQQQHQQQTTPLSASLTPQSTGSGGVMGLQKDFIKDSTEMDQVLGDMDLLQVLKGFDSTSGGGEAALCDLAGSLGLFNDVDVMSYEEIVTPAPKNLETDEIRNEIERRQQQMQRKCDFLLRRLRKIQARSMGKHTSEEISGLFEWTNRLIRRKDHDQLPDICYDDDKHRPVTQAAMRSLLKRIDSVATTQHSNSTNNNGNGGSTSLTLSLNINNSTAQKKNNKNILGRTNSLQTTSNNFPTNIDNKKLTIIQKYDGKSTDEIGHIAGLLQTEMREIQCAFDSDVTASSSGGESADEMVTYNNQVQQSLSISKRAAWRWARDRSSIASRWTWLCAQISDLEYRIRQHNELYLQIKKNKGSVTFEKFSNLSTSSVDCSSTVDSSTNIFGANGLRGGSGSNNKSQQLGANNNLITESPIATTTSATVPPNGVYDQITGACRTRAFQRIGFRKRKLLQTANVHTISKKAARPSTVKCGCQWPLHPCALCTGRSDPTAPRDLPDTMTESERVALLDPGFHPVLSFGEDVPNSIHIEATLQIPEWQNRIIRNSSKLSSKNSLLSIQKSHNRDDRSLSTSKKFRTSQKSSRKQQQQDMTSSPISGNQVGGGISGTLSSSANKIKTSKNRKNHEYHHSGVSSMMTTPTASSPQHQFNSSLSGKSSKQRKLLSSSNVAGATLINSNNSGGGNGSGSTNGSSCGGGGGTSNMNGFQNAFAESLVNLNCDNLDGAANGPLYPRSKTSSPTPTGRGSGEAKEGHHYSGGGSYKYERMMERRNRNSYDIDNIVIPYSVAAATRVELLPYKEIPTPKWRVIGDDEDELEEPNKLILSTTLEDDEKFLCPKEINSTNVEIKMNNNNKINETTATVELLPPPSPIVIQSPANENNKESDKKINNINSLNNASDTTSITKSPSVENDIKQQQQQEDDENYNEDISEEAIHNRHERALLEERKKFSTFLKFPWSTRSRANRRIDSRAESSGANTPDPTSPAPNTPSVGGDQESIPSPAAPSTPLTITENVDGLDNNNSQSIPSTTTYPAVNNINFSAARRGERKRTVSAKKEKEPNKSGGVGGGDDQRRSSSPDPREIIPPFDPLQFPLADDLYETMLKMMPNHHQLIDECLKLTTSNTDYNNTMNSIESNDTKFMELSNRINNNINTNSSNNSSRKNSTSSIQNQCDSINTSIFSIPNQDLFSNSYNNKNNNSNQNYVKENDISIFDNVERQLRLLEDSDTDSAESGIPDEDPNDPEWKEPE